MAKIQSFRGFYWGGVLLSLLAGGLPAAGAREPQNLTEAVDAGSAISAELYLMRGESPNMELRDEPLIVHAARAGHFDLSRVLLQHGADPNARTRAGIALLDLVPLDSKDSMALSYLLRMHGMLKEHGRPPAESVPKRPQLVIVFEPTVDYLHPQIGGFYFVNQSELNGQSGVDDDGDGFIDNIYGWSLVADRPHHLNLLQQQTWLEYRERITELVDLHNRAAQGELSREGAVFARLKKSFRNPISALFGASGGYSDADFLDDVVDLSHGSHVAGTIIEFSEARCLLHTLSWENYGHQDTLAFDLPPVTGGDPEIWLREFRRRSLPEMIARGRRASDYLRAVQCGVVNGSFGMNFLNYIARASDLVGQMQAFDPSLESSVVKHLANELYAYATIPFAIAVAENPQVLFVAAAGNVSTNIDVAMLVPAVLSRFFPNVLSVAAADRAGDLAEFSNFGRHTATIGAPGTGIESFGIAGSRVVMSGTSMAAPAVSGFAAKLRAMRPELEAKEVAHLIQLGATSTGGNWPRFVAAGGMLNPQRSLAILNQDSDAIAEMSWHLTEGNFEGLPEAWIRAMDIIHMSARRHRDRSPLWMSLAALQDEAGLHAQALSSISRAFDITQDDPLLWRCRCLIEYRGGRYADVLATVDQYLARFGESPTDVELHRDMLRLALAAARESRSLDAGERIQSLYQAYRPLLPHITARAQGESLQTIDDCLNTNSRLYPRGNHARDFHFQGRAGTEIRIDMKSDDIDTYLLLLSPDGTTWINDDFDENTTNSRLEVTLPADGEYHIIATTYLPRETGCYTLTVTSEDPELNLEDRLIPDRHRRFSNSSARTR